MEIKPAMVAIAAFVAITVIAAVLMPVLADATKTENTFTNEGYYDMQYTESDAVNIAWDHTKPHQVTINNVDVQLPENPSVSLTIVCGDGWLIRYTGSAFQMYLNASSNRSASVADETDATFVAYGGTAVFTSTADSNNTATVFYTFMYYIDSTGPYVMKISDGAAYVKSDSLMYGQGRTYAVSSSMMLRVEGSVDDGVTVTNIYPNSDLEFSEATINKTEVNGYKDLYEVSTITFDVTKISTSDTAEVTYSYFLVPAEVTAEKSVHFTDGENAILLVIPALVIVAIIVGVLALAFRSRE